MKKMNMNYEHFWQQNKLLIACSTNFLKLPPILSKNPTLMLEKVKQRGCKSAPLLMLSLLLCNLPSESLPLRPRPRHSSVVICSPVLNHSVGQGTYNLLVEPRFEPTH